MHIVTSHRHDSKNHEKSEYFIQETADIIFLSSADTEISLLSKSNNGNLFLASGTGRQGILLGPAMGKLSVDSMLSKNTSISIKPFSHERFF